MAFETTFTTAGGDFSSSDTTWVKLPLTPGEGPPNSATQQDQVIAVRAHSGATSATAAVLGFALVEPDAATHKIVEYFTCTLTPNARRTNLANSAANNYNCTVAFTDGTNKLDIAGHSHPITALSGTNGATQTRRGSNLEWRMKLISDGGSIQPVTVIVEPLRVV